MPDVPLGVERKDGEITVKMILLLPSFWKRTTIGLVANCHEKNEKLESTQQRAFGVGNRIPWSVCGEGRHSAGTIEL